MSLSGEKSIEELMRSGEGLSASGVDRVSHQIVKKAGPGGVTFMKSLVKARIQSGRVINTWKEAKSILPSKKGDQHEIRNWRAISIPNCMSRIFTCFMARTFQFIKSEAYIFSNSQTGFIKKTNACSEHGIILNELLYNAKRNSESLVVTAIDFTNAFRQFRIEPVENQIGVTVQAYADNMILISDNAVGIKEIPENH
jgi:hypothetical protein